jgi:uncharacterized membrane protein
MDAAHLHLLVNHIPVLGTIAGLFVLLYGLARRQQPVVQVALAFFVVAGLAAVVAYLSGEEAEHLLEEVGGVSETILEPHEDAGFYALLAASVLGVFALGSLVFFRQTLPRSLATALLVLALAVSGVMGWTAYLGGQIQHPEIRPETTQLLQAPASSYAADNDAADDDAVEQ